MIVFKQPMRLALAKQQANENFLTCHTFKRQFLVFPLCRPDKIILPNSNQNKHGGKLRER